MAEVRLAGVVIDCADVAGLAQFWRAVIGATFLRRPADPEDPFVTLADPEGNEFCIVRAVPAPDAGNP